jgi:dTDP-glucose 4,6-dehydratase
VSSLDVARAARSRTIDPLSADREHVLAHTRALWDEVKGQRVFLTGGTGFVGSWLMHSLVWANDVFGLGAEAVVLTRRPEAFHAKAPAIAAHPSVRVLEGDVRTFAFPDVSCSLIVHAAADIARSGVPGGGRAMVDTIIDGTRRVLDFARHARARRVLYISSGAVYGRQPDSMTHIPEDYDGAPRILDPSSTYGAAKRLAELLTIVAGREDGVDVVIARVRRSVLVARRGVCHEPVPPERAPRRARARDW